MTRVSRDTFHSSVISRFHDDANIAETASANYFLGANLNKSSR